MGSLEPRNEGKLLFPHIVGPSVAVPEVLSPDWGPAVQDGCGHTGEI